LVNAFQNPAYDAAGMEARFAVAARHSRIVRLLRIAVPAAVVVSLATIILVSVFNPFRMLLPKLPVDMSNLVISGTKVTMESPHLAGYSTDRRPYEVWANTAVQDVTDPDHVELHTLRGKMLMEDQSTVTLEAVNGLMDTKQQLLTLHKDIYVHTTTGYDAWLSQAFVDMNKGTVTSDEHVDVKWADGKISADTMKVLGGGETVRFDGHVVMNIDKMPPPADTPPPEPAPQPKAAKSRPAVKSSNAK
jgi:lipopolysaccharide export system protein LptC